MYYKLPSPAPNAQERLPMASSSAPMYLDAWFAEQMKKKAGPALVMVAAVYEQLLAWHRQGFTHLGNDYDVKVIKPLQRRQVSGHCIFATIDSKAAGEETLARLSAGWKLKP